MAADSSSSAPGSPSPKSPSEPVPTRPFDPNLRVDGHSKSVPIDSTAEVEHNVAPAWRSPSLYFLSQQIGRWRWPWLLAGLLAGLFSVTAILVVMFVPLLIAEELGVGIASWAETAFEGDEEATDPLSVMVMLALVGFVFWTMAIVGSLVQGRPVRSLLAPAKAFRWNLVGKAMIVTVALNLAVQLFVLLLSGSETVFTGLRLDHAIWLLPLAVAVLFQTSGEDVYFKNYLIRQLGAVTKLYWIAPVVVTIVFVWLHVGNSDLQQNSWLILPLFVLGEFVIIAFVLRTAGIEMALVSHWVNNAMIFLLFAEEGTQANDLTLFVTEQASPDTALTKDLIFGAFYLLYWATYIAAFCWKRSPFYIEATHLTPSTSTIGDELAQREPPLSV